MSRPDGGSLQAVSLGAALYTTGGYSRSWQMIPHLCFRQTFSALRRLTFNTRAFRDRSLWQKRFQCTYLGVVWLLLRRLMSHGLENLDTGSARREHILLDCVCPGRGIGPASEKRRTVWSLCWTEGIFETSSHLSTAVAQH